MGNVAHMGTRTSTSRNLKLGAMASWLHLHATTSTPYQFESSPLSAVVSRAKLGESNACPGPGHLLISPNIVRLDQAKPNGLISCLGAVHLENT